MTFDPHLKTADDLWDDIFTTEATAKQAEAVQPLKLDRKAAKRFLDALHGGDSSNVPFTFQTADDNKVRKATHLARVHTLTLANAATPLEELNRQGAAVWVTINKTDGKGRKKENVTSVRAAFFELDGAPLEPVRTWTLKPYILVESSPGKYHGYYRTDGTVTLEAFSTIQLKLATLFNGDASVNDLSRVMRLPGAWHLKGAPFHTRIISIDESAPRYSLTDFETALASVEIPDGTPGLGKPKGERKPRKALHAAEWLNQEALHRLKDWAPHFFPGGRWSGEDGAWRVSSEKLCRHPTAQDLSVHPDGVRDFGQQNWPESGDLERVTYSPLKLLMAFFNVVDGELELAEFDDCCRPQGTVTYDQAATALAAALGMDWAALLEEDRNNAEGLEAIDIEAPKDEAPNQEKKPPKLPFINFSNWDNEPVPDQEWAVADRIPHQNVHLRSGGGGTGKSTIGLQQAVAHVLGREWLGMAARQGPAIFFDAEDPVTVLHRRLADVASYYGVSFATLFAAGLHLLSYADRDDKLLAVPGGGLMVKTATFTELEGVVKDIKPAAVIINSAADVFAGSEIDRLQVNQFVGGMLRPLAIRGDTSVVLGAHPSVRGLKDRTGESGSTQWHNSSRSREVLWAEEEDANGVDTGLRKLTFPKNQYGPASREITLRWQRGLFLPVSSGIDDRVAAAELADVVFLKLLGRFADSNRDVCDKAGTAYAPSLFAAEAEAKEYRLKKADMADAMRRLFMANKIHVAKEGPASKQRRRLRLGATPEAK
jgi:RecA-family ATPase